MPPRDAAAVELLARDERRRVPAVARRADQSRVTAGASDEPDALHLAVAIVNFGCARRDHRTREFAGNEAQVIAVRSLQFDRASASRSLLVRRVMRMSLPPASFGDEIWKVRAERVRQWKTTKKS
jgi:hypothetical protein